MMHEICDTISFLIDVLNVFRGLWAIKVPILILVVIYLTFRNVEKIQIWVSIIQKYFSSLSARIERKSISNNIEGKINLFAKKFNTQLDGILPYAIKIEWVEDKDITVEAFIRDDQLIVKMKQHVNQDRNLVIAALGFISRGLLPTARNYISKPILQSIDFKMLHKILLSNRETSAIEYFFKEVFPSETKDKPEIVEYLKKMHDIDDHGFFMTILLTELARLGKILPPDVNNIRKRAISEVKQLIDFLHNLAVSSPGDIVDLNFIKKELKLAILIVAKPEKIIMGEKQYLNSFRKKLQEGSERIYVISSGNNVRFAKTVCSSVLGNFKVEQILEDHCKMLNRRGKLTDGYTCLFQKTSVS